MGSSCGVFQEEVLQGSEPGDEKGDVNHLPADKVISDGDMVPCPIRCKDIPKGLSKLHYR